MNKLFTAGQRVIHTTVDNESTEHSFGFYVDETVAAIFPPGNAEFGPQEDFVLISSLKPASSLKWLKVMADYSSCGLWEQEGCEATLDEIPLTYFTKTRLSHWCGMFELNDDYMPEKERRKPEFPLEFFAMWGEILARQIKKELPDWTIIYFNDFKSHGVSHTEDYRSIYEYEITG